MRRIYFAVHGSMSNSTVISHLCAVTWYLFESGFEVSARQRWGCGSRQCSSTMKTGCCPSGQLVHLRNGLLTGQEAVLDVGEYTTVFRALTGPVLLQESFMVLRLRFRPEHSWKQKRHRLHIRGRKLQWCWTWPLLHVSARAREVVWDGIMQIRWGTTGLKVSLALHNKPIVRGHRNKQANAVHLRMKWVTMSRYPRQPRWLNAFSFIDRATR